MSLKKDLHIDLYLDSKSLFKIITRCSSSSKKGLMIDFKAMQQAYQRFNILSIYYIVSEFNPCHAMTKAVNNATLVKLATEGKIDHPIELPCIVLNEWNILNKKKSFLMLKRITSLMKHR